MILKTTRSSLILIKRTTPIVPMSAACIIVPFHLQRIQFPYLLKQVKKHIKKIKPVYKIVNVTFVWHKFSFLSLKESSWQFRPLVAFELVNSFGLFAD